MRMDCAQHLFADDSPVMPDLRSIYFVVLEEDTKFMPLYWCCWLPWLGEGSALAQFLQLSMFASRNT